VRRTFASAIALCLAGAAAACAEPADDTFAIGPSGPAEATGDPGEVADRAVRDVTAYWEETYPEIYGDPWRPVAGFYPYGPDTEPPPCGEPPPRYEEIADNAFYCPGDDIIAWDEAQLLPELNESFGAFTIGIVIAHEYGHAVQDRAAAFDRTIDLELQADCFAGAWTARVADGEAEGFSPEDVDLDRTVAGMIAIRDLPGTDPDDMFAHGSGFDRVAAFQDGYDNSAEACVGYADESEDRLTAQILADQEFIETGGDFPLYDEETETGEGLFTLVERDLNAFYTAMFEELGQQFTPVGDLVLVDPATDTVDCGGESRGGADLEFAALFCEDENVAVLDEAQLVPALYDEIGDFAVAAEVARLWAIAAQSQLGVADDDGSDLQADCLTGAWAAWTFPVDGEARSPELEISPGDLDEGIQAFLAYGSVGGGATVFDRTEALRAGFFESYDACEQFAPLG
jgi:predicted metalloprotease